jgi:sugar/nucleoside kinase (ribokinase family)
MSLLTVGSVAFDAIETPFGKTDKIVGGAASYIALCSSYFVPKVNLVSVVGGDFPKNDLEFLRSRGVNTDGLQVKENEKTFFWAGKYHNDMNSRDTLITELNVLGDFNPVIPESYQDCSYLMLGNLAPSVQRQVIESLRKKPKLIVMDTMNFWMVSALDELRKVLTMVDVLSVNDEEARQLSGEYSLVRAARKIMAMGPRYLIIKKGEHGALLFGENRIFFAPALPLEEVFDPTGAGDTFAGGFISYLAQHNRTDFESMTHAVVNGSAMASFCVEKFGWERLRELSSEDIAKRKASFYDLVHSGGYVL